jgi:hypothetical protein
MTVKNTVTLAFTTSDKFVTAVNKRKKVLAVKETPNSITQPPTRNNITLIRDRSLSTLPIFTKRPRTKSLLSLSFSLMFQENTLNITSGATEVNFAHPYHAKDKF